MSGIRTQPQLPAYLGFRLPYAVLAVATGDRVQPGTPLDFSDCPYHAPLAGRIEIEGIPGATANLRLIPDAGPSSLTASMVPWPDWRQRPPAELLDRIHQAGIAGLGGGAFPTHRKLRAAMARPVELLVGNGVECEPGIRCDSALWHDQAAGIITGLQIVAELLGRPRTVLALGRHLAAPATLPPGIELATIAEHRPAAGEERRLLAALGGPRLQRPAHPTDHGMLCLNLGTLYAIAEAVCHGRPLTRRVVTLPEGNTWLPLGYPLAALYPGRSCRIGGRWSGIRAAADAAVDKGTNAIQVDPRQAEDPCIRCGHCRDACPEQLLPDLLLERARADATGSSQSDSLQQLGLNACIQCGLCDASCPSGIALTESFHQAAAAVAHQAARAAAADRARVRHLAHTQRAAQREKTARVRRQQRLRRNRSWQS